MRTLGTAERLEQDFCDLMDQDGPVVIGGISFDPSRILREMDPIAYDQELYNYLDSQGFDPDAVD